MIRRILMLVAAAALALLAPSVALADYEAPGFSSTVSDSTPAAGQCITMTVNGGEANAGEVFTLNVTGPEAKSSTATANEDGVAKFQVCLSKVGEYTLTVTNSAGQVVATQTVTVHAAGTDDNGGSLSQTGSNFLPLAAGGALLVLLGVAAVVIARRRSDSKAHV